jgi:putative membrane protein
VKTIMLALLELRRFRGPLLRLVPFALALVPVASAAVYLWSAWDPFGRTPSIPVAVVNQDLPVTSKGALVNGGQILVQQLRKDPFFDWRFVSEATARRGLRDGRYAFTITVPPDFSARLASPASLGPQRASTLITLNDANGYLTGTIAATTQARLQNQIDAAARTAFAQRVLGNLDALRGGLTTAATTATSQRDGTTRLAQDIDKLGQQQRAAGQLASSAQQFASSVQQVSGAVSGAASSLAGQGSAAQAVATASTSAQRSASQAAGGISTAQQQANLAVVALTRLGQSQPFLGADPNYQVAIAAARQASRAAATAGVSARQASSSAGQAVASAQQIQSASQSALQQLRTASSQSTDLVRTSQQLADGAGQLRTGLDALITGPHSLQAQVGQLQRAAGQLADGLRAAIDQIPPANLQQRAQIVSTLGSPVDLRVVNLHPARSYGRGLAPLFCGIALWIFGLIAYTVVRPLNARALAGRTRAMTIALAGWLPAAGIGVVGALLLYAVLAGGLGLDPLHPLWTVALLVLTVCALVAGIHMLCAAFGLWGLALSLVLLAFQLTASSGLYPLETAPTLFRSIHPLCPLTYVVQGLRVTISGGEPYQLIRAAAVLGGLLLASLGVTALVAMRRRVWTVGRLAHHPAADLADL